LVRKIEERRLPEEVLSVVKYEDGLN